MAVVSMFDLKKILKDGHYDKRTYFCEKAHGRDDHGHPSKINRKCVTRSSIKDRI